MRAVELVIKSVQQLAQQNHTNNERAEYVQFISHIFFTYNGNNNKHKHSPKPKMSWNKTHLVVQWTLKVRCPRRK